MKDYEVVIRTVPKEQIRNAGIGDYKEIDEKIVIMSADFKDTDVQFLIKLHEFIEEYLTRRIGILEPDINQFDADFEEEREIGIHKEADEPGDDPRSPYFNQHQFATRIEKLACEEIGMTWEQYEKKINDALQG